MKTFKTLNAVTTCLVVMTVMTGSAPGADFEGDITFAAVVNGEGAVFQKVYYDEDGELDALLDVYVGDEVALTASWSVNKDVTRYEWIVDGRSQGATEILNEDKQEGSRTFVVPTDDVWTYEIELRIWHHKQDREVCESVFIRVNEREQVEYGFNGLLAPYSDLKAFKINSAIPLKWQYTLDDELIDSSGFDVEVFIWQVTDVPLPGEESPAEIYASGASGYQYDTDTDTWQFNWKTKGWDDGVYSIFIYCVDEDGNEQWNGPFDIQLKK